MQNKPFALTILSISICLSFMLSACSSQSVKPSPSIVSPTGLPLSAAPVNTTSIDTLTPQQSSTNTPQVKYLNLYASVLPGEYLACQIYDPGSPFMFKLSLINVSDGKMTTLLDGIPVSAITPDGKYVIFGNEANKLFYIQNLETDQYKPISKTTEYRYPEYDYPEISPNGSELIFVHLTRGILIWSVNAMRPLIQANIIQNPSDSMVQDVYRSINGDNFAFYTRYTKGPKPIEGLYVIAKSCLATPETCISNTNKLVSEPYGSAPIAWTPEGNLAVVDWGINNGARINIYGIPNNHKIIKTINLNPNDGEIDYLYWSPNNDIIAVQQANINYITLILPDGKIQGKVDSCGGQLLGWVIIGTKK